MNTITLLRHSLTAANEAHLYCGVTDLPLSSAGIALARDRSAAIRGEDFGLFIDTGLLRSSQTLKLLTGRTADLSIPELRECDFGLFEMHSYEELKRDKDYLNWIMDERGDVHCPGGESRNCFQDRVLRGAGLLLDRPETSALLVCHGGVIVHLMQTWFPQETRNYYEWQPQACRGYIVHFSHHSPCGWLEV